jgi:inosose dehydratase
MATARTSPPPVREDSAPSATAPLTAASVTTAAATTAPATTAPSPAAPRIGIAPDSWGVWNPVDPAQPEPEQYLREAAEAGFHWTELGPYGYLGTDPARLADQFAEHALQLSAGTQAMPLEQGAAALEEVWAGTREVAALVTALGGEHLIALPSMWEREADGRVRGPRTLDAQGWGRLTAGLDEIGRRLREEFGLALQFHSHADSPVGTRTEVLRLLEGTDPGNVNLCLDTGHLAYYQADPVRLLREVPERIGYLHLKQVAPDVLADVLKNDVSFAEAVGRGVMVEPPHGVPGYGPVLELAAAARPGILAIVEQDLYPVADLSEPVRIARRTREHIAGCGAEVRFR